MFKNYIFIHYIFLVVVVYSISISGHGSDICSAIGYIGGHDSCSSSDSGHSSGRCSGSGSSSGSSDNHSSILLLIFIMP